MSVNQISDQTKSGTLSSNNAQFSNPNVTERGDEIIFNGGYRGPEITYKNKEYIFYVMTTHKTRWSNIKIITTVIIFK